MAKTELEINQFECSHCGFILSHGGTEGEVECPYCGNKTKIGAKKAVENRNYNVDDHSLRISFGGGKAYNPAAILVYLEDYLQKEKNYVKNEFDEVGIGELNELVEELKMTHGDQSEMWKLAFLAISEPTRIRLENVNDFVNEMADSVRNKEEEKAYAVFDNYVNAIRKLKEVKDQVFIELERSLERFIKMNGSEQEVEELKQKKQYIEDQFASLPEAPEKLSDVEYLKQVKEERDLQISGELLAKGIYVEDLYQEILEEKERGHFGAALHKLNVIGDYKDCADIRSELSRYTEVGEDLLMIAGKPFLAVNHNPNLDEENNPKKAKKKKKKKKKGATEEPKEVRSGNGYDLINIVDGEPDYKKPLIRDYVRCLSIFGNFFYYISRKGTIHSFDLNSFIDRELETTGQHYEKTYYERNESGTKGWLLSKAIIPSGKHKSEPQIKKGEEVELDTVGANTLRLIELNFGVDDNFIKVVADQISGIEPFNDGKYIKNGFINIVRQHYFKSRTNKNEYKNRTEKQRILVSLASCLEYADFIGEDDRFVAVVDKDLYFTRYAPTKYNISLMKKNLDTLEEKEVLTNAFRVIEIQKEHVFYTVGNTNKESLVNLNMETGHKCIVFDRYNGYADHFDGYFYLYRGDEYNRTLFKIKDDGTSQLVLARNIDLSSGKFRMFKDGYYYYENINQELCVVRIDGSKHKVISKNLEKVVKVESNTIYYSRQETTDKLYYNEEQKKGTKYRKSLSIYKYNINDQGSDKILFAVDGWSYDGYDTLYFYRISDEEFRSINMPKDMNFNVKTTLHIYSKMKLSTLEITDLFTIGLPHQEREKGCSLIWWLFHRKEDTNTQFKKLSWIRPYLTDKRRDENR